MKKVALYLRVSTEEQVINWYGLDIQKESLLNYAKIHWFQIDENHIFVDEWKSWADKKDRPALKRLLESAKNKEFEIVLVWKVDRFFRKVLFLLEWVEALESLWVWFTSVTQPFDTTQPFWKMMLQMMWVIAELERELIKERTFNWILASMRDWKWGRWNAPFWYRRGKEWFLEIQEDEADVIKIIFSMLNVDWFNVNQIRDKLTSMNIETAWSRWWLWVNRKKNIKNKNLWQWSTVHKILRNEAYKWVLIQNRFKADKITKKRVEKPEKEWIIWKSPKIISEKEYNKAQLTLNKNLKFSKKNTKKWETYMLAKLIVNDPTWYKYVWYKSTKWTKNYKLSVNKSKISNFHEIWSRWISALKIETPIWDKLKSVLKNPNILEKELIRMSEKWENREKEIRNKISMLDENLNKLSDNTKWLLKLVSWVDENSIVMIQNEIKKNNTTAEGIRREKTILDRELSWTNEIKDKVDNFISVSKLVNDNLDNLSYETKAELCKLLIDKVVFDWNNITIHLIVPLSPKNKSTIKVDVVKDFFNEKKEFLWKTIMGAKEDIVSGIDMIKNLNTYYYQYTSKYIKSEPEYSSSDFIFIKNI